MQIYDVLKKDHEKVRMLLNELVMLGENDGNRRESLVQEIRDELVPHARAEESVFYNSLRSLDAAKDIIMHSYTEHLEAEGLLRTLQGADKIDAGWKETARKLKEAIEHHIQEEEGKIFNVAKQLFTNDEAVMMGEVFEKMKPEVREEGFMKNTLDMVVNMMPPRFAASLRAATSPNPMR
jgi:hemerythrin superfamily protein